MNVTVLMPGATETEFFERAEMLDAKIARSDKDDPADVAAAALRALRSHSDHVVTGAKNKLQAGVAKLMPDEAAAKAHGKQTQRQPH